MDFPKLSQPSLEPLNLLFDNLMAGLDRFADMNLDGQSQGIILELRSLLSDEKTKCLETLPGEFSRLITEYEQVKNEYIDLENVVFPEINCQLNDLKTTLESALKLKNPQVTQMIPESPLGHQELPLAEGGVLKKDILNLRNGSAGSGAGPTPGSRVSGNIWENWKKPGE
jgi:hypothetical protein